MIERTVSSNGQNRGVDLLVEPPQIDPLFEELAARARKEGLVQRISAGSSNVQLPPLPVLDTGTAAFTDTDLFAPSINLQGLDRAPSSAPKAEPGETLLGFSVPTGPIRLISDMLTTDGAITRSDGTGIAVTAGGISVAIERLANQPGRVSVDIAGTRQTATLRPGNTRASLQLEDGRTAEIARENNGRLSLTGILPVTVQIQPLSQLLGDAGSVAGASWQAQRALLPEPRTVAEERGVLPATAEMTNEARSKTGTIMPLLPLADVNGPTRPILVPPPPLPKPPGDLKWNLWRRPARNDKPAVFGGGLAYTDPDSGRNISGHVRSDGTLVIKGATQVDGLGGLIAKIIPFLSGLFSSSGNAEKGRMDLLKGPSRD